jgi:hypothetical protein
LVLFRLARVPHLRPPSVDHGVVAFFWALGLAAFIWAGQLAVGVSQPTAVIIAIVCFAAIFLLVRVYGEERP